MFLGLLSVSLWSCDEENLPLDRACIEARVITEICGQAVIQVISPDIDGLGEDNWTDGQGNTYDNVFSTQFSCEDMDNIPEDGSTFYLEVVEELAPQNCLVCLAIPAHMPETRLNIRVANNCSGTTE